MLEGVSIGIEVCGVNCPSGLRSEINHGKT
jgi:hypothetical protein